MDVEYKMNRVEQLKSIQNEALELFTRKNADYGDAFAKYGIVGVLMRIEDKIQRALSITKNGVILVNDEKLKDTLLDLHNYAAMALMVNEDPMDDLFKALAENGHAKCDDVTLECVIANTAQDCPTLNILMKYQEYAKSTIGDLKRRFLMKDCSI
jgi:hypothetical protein